MFSQGTIIQRPILTEIQFVVPREKKRRRRRRKRRKKNEIEIFKLIEIN